MMLDNPYITGAIWVTTGALLGYWLLRWKERALRAALAIKEQGILESARRQADNIAREARLQANEEALKVREQAEKSITARGGAAAEAEKRLVERESLINRQLENLVHEEKSLREQKLDCKNRAKELEVQRAELTGLIHQRREALQTVCRLTEAEARQLLLKEVELE